MDDSKNDPQQRSIKSRSACGSPAAPPRSSSRPDEQDAGPASFVRRHHGTMSRKRNSSKIGLLVGFCMAAVVSSFQHAGGAFLLPRHRASARPAAATTAGRVKGAAETSGFPATASLERLSSSTATTLFCNRREPWHGGGGSITNTTNIRNKYTVYGRRFNGGGSTVADGAVAAAAAVANDTCNRGLVASSSSSSSHYKRAAPGIHGFMNGWDAQWINASSFNVHNLLPTDWIEIENYWDRIMPAVSYLGTEKVAKIYKALCVAYSAHRGQMRKSGEPFIVHPVEVSLLLAGLKMDAETVIAGLLHDTVEDTDLTFEEVEILFGPMIRKIVEGETKVSKLPRHLSFSKQEQTDEQAENLRQMFVAMTDDYRIIIVKLADRLHNMRTLNFMKPEKQIKISRETLDVFAPLAHRMGIWQFKAELEDTSFKYLYPVEYKRLNRRLRQHQKYFRELLDRSKDHLQRRLNVDPTLMQQAAKVEVSGRTKELYSLWLKMETKKEHRLENIRDVIGLRVVITPKIPEEDDGVNESDRGVWLCYHVLGLVQHLYGFQPVPTKVKDYISFPKPNGYQSLHTALIVDGQSIEVQIRTKMMHRVAEYGMASHWAYADKKRRKLNDGSVNNEDELINFNTPWMAAIKEWQNEDISSRDFVDSVRRELLGKRVFVFLRNGKILNLPRGATIVDVAFQIHTEVGLKMHGAEINGKPVAFSYELQNGDSVSILSGKGKPGIDWMRSANSRSTRSKLRAYFRARQRDSFLDAGKIIMRDYLWMHGQLIEQNSRLGKVFTVPTDDVTKLQSFLPGKSQFSDVEDLLVEVGKQRGRESLHTIISQIFSVSKTKLLHAEEQRKEHPRSGGVISAVLGGRGRAQDVAKFLSFSGNSTFSTPRQPPNPSTENEATETGSFCGGEDLYAYIDTPIELADPEYVCKDCLPVHGDAIIGTRRVTARGEEAAIPTVHRMSCPHAQQALNRAKGLSRDGLNWKNGSSIAAYFPRIDSVSLRGWKTQKKDSGIATTTTTHLSSHHDEVPVRLEWCDYDCESADFLTEVVVVAEDRKLLLSDCSAVVSETVEILKTGSATTNEHATLVFLVKVSCLEDIQILLDRLSRIRSVMSVERRFGSALLQT